MPLTNFPDGFSHGLVLRNQPLVQLQPGAAFWVTNSNTLLRNQMPGSNNNRGTILEPFGTITFALSMCQQGRGDIIFVGPGHQETISDAVTLAFNVANVAIIGIGQGPLRPTITFSTAATANILLQAGGMSIQNILFQANFADIASVVTASRGSSATSTITGTTFTAVGAITGVFVPGMVLRGTGVTPGTFITAQLTGATSSTTGSTFSVNQSQTVTSTTITGTTPDFLIDNCEFRDTTSVLNFITIVTGNATANALDGLTFTNNRISSLGTTAATTAIKVSSATDRVQIKGNYGNWAVLNDTACMLAAGANNITNFDFGGNRLNKPNTSSTGGSFISTSGTAWTGHCYDNYLWQLDASAGIWIATGTKLAFSQNFSPITGAADTSGLINPAAA